MWGLCMPNFSPLALMLWEEEDVTDGKRDKGSHAISLTSPLALLGSDKLKISTFGLHMQRTLNINPMLKSYFRATDIVMYKSTLHTVANAF